MSVFGRYADWYDLFYADKDYHAEAQYVGRLLRGHGVRGRRLLEVGCGTGVHAHWLVADGWQVCGIDRSTDMLERARIRLAGRQGLTEFHVGDARTFDLNRQFDAAISLFHVMSYQADPNDITAALQAVRRHLTAGGVFLFDFWFGPAVLVQRPEPRTRTVEDARYRVVRKATPNLKTAQQVVDVRYDFDVSDKFDDRTCTYDELHRMRYLFADEIMELASVAGFHLENVYAWMEPRLPDEKSWNACAILRAVG